MGKYRQKLELKPKLTIKTAIKQRLIIGGSTLAIAVIFGIGAFIYGNFGTSHDSMAAIGSNMGFENGTTEWTINSGTWAASTASYRSGAKSLKCTTISTDVKTSNTNSTIAVPASGTNYVTITVWAKGSNANGRIKLGAYDVTNSTESICTTYLNPVASGFKIFSYTFAATNGHTYYPTLYASYGNGNSMDVYFDDVLIYTSTTSTTDETKPTAPSTVSAACSGNNVTLSWTNGTDAESGISGVMVLRQAGTLSDDQDVNAQTTYSTTSTTGPTAAGSYAVVYNGPLVSTVTDNPGATGTYTYLIYMRDKNYNYTDKNSAARIWVLNGSSLSATISTGSYIDGLYLPSGSTLTISSSTTRLRSGANITVSGTLNINSTLTELSSSTMNISGLVTIGNSANLNASSGSTVNINSGGRFRKDGGGVDLTAGVWTINSGGTYQHNDNGTSIPNATWNTGSTCEITGTTTNGPGNMDQSFYNFTWNCPSQTVNKNLSSNFTTINGDFNIISTGSGSIMLAQGASQALNIAGNYYHQGGTLYITESGSWAINLTGNYVQTGGNFNMTNATSGTGAGTPTMNVMGNFTVSSGIFNMSQYTLANVNNGHGTLNLSGDFTFSGGTITETSLLVGDGTINFIKSGTQRVTGGGTISNTINFNVASGSVLNMGGSVFTGTGSFTSNSGATLSVGSASGITTLGLTGNIQVLGTKTYSSGGSYIFNGASSQVTGSALPSSVVNLTINNTAGVTLSSSVTVTGTLTLTNGVLTTGLLNSINVTNAATNSVSGYSSSGYVVGTLKRSVNSSGSYDFPLGTSSKYEMINITLSGIAGFSNITGTFTNSSPLASIPLVNVLTGNTPINNLLNYGYWTLTPNSSLTGGSYSVSLNQQGHSNSAPSAGCYCVLKRHDALSAWESLGTHLNSTQTVVAGVVKAVRSGLTSFSDYAIGYGGSVLPITLSSFTVALVTDHADVKWTTSAEMNNAFFSVERSANGKDYEAIGEVEGNGTSVVTHEYSLQDIHPLAGTSYYRLKQVDLDGTFSYSAIQSINNESENSTPQEEPATINLFPNPATTDINVELTIAADLETTIDIIDLSGKQVYSRHLQLTVGQSITKLPLNDLSKGIYFVRLNKKGDKPVMQKFIKQ